MVVFHTVAHGASCPETLFADNMQHVRVDCRICQHVGKLQEVEGGPLPCVGMCCDLDMQRTVQ